MRFLLALLLLALIVTPAAADPVLSGSYYHSNFDGRPDACGGTYDPDEMTAASNHFPCNTRLRVSRGDRSVVVRVSDRCGRCGIDLSRAAAKQIGLVRVGRAPVRIERVDYGTTE